MQKLIPTSRIGKAAIILLALVISNACHSWSERAEEPAPAKANPSTQSSTQPLNGFAFPIAPPVKRSKEEVAAGSASCVVCHTDSDAHTMHKMDVGISCVDCHGGFAMIDVPAALDPKSAEYRRYIDLTHVQPKLKDLWKSSANPEIPAGRTLEESVDFIRFVNPGDLRAAPAACAPCHADEVAKVNTSMMTHGAMLWSAALYNNGAITRKDAVFGESYVSSGQPAKLIATSQPTTQQTRDEGILTSLWPLLRWEISQPGNVLRVFERGGKRRPIIGIPDPLEDPGRPDVKLSIRGFGTDVRTDPVFLGLQKTRLLDPTLNMFGTNDHAGDFRASGCTACHVVYANDRSPVHSGLWAKFGNKGTSDTKDPTIPKDEKGHPIQHVFVKNMPTSTCIVCHVHPGTNVVNSYLGYMWWDNESDAHAMYPKQQRYPSADDEFNIHQHNPEGAAPRGMWSDPKFLAETGSPEFNKQLKHNQFGDFHGHGWVFRKVWKQDRHGNLLDAGGKVVPFDDAEKWSKTVHLKDIHLEKGMSCVDCHFEQDSHGNGNLYGETRNATMIECIDCHGTTEKPSVLFAAAKFASERKFGEVDKIIGNAFSGPAAAWPGIDEEKRNIRYKKILERFKYDRRTGGMTQASAVESDKSWPVVQTIDTSDPGSQWAQATSSTQSRAARYAHTIRKDGKTWGTVPAPDERDANMMLAHADSRMSCYACHTSWNTSCFGCHLPMRANQRKPMLHNEAVTSRNYTSYNFQTLRDDVYMLGVDSTVKGNKIVPVRSACAVLVGSQDANRQWLYSQQQTISAEGFSGTAFSPYFPHTVRAAETKQCSDCHVSDKNDNNAIMAQLLLQGTNAVNFVGRFAYVGLGSHGLEAIAVTERDEPQAVIGSRLHEAAYPDFFKQHIENSSFLTEAHSHHGTVLDVQLRGEYLYAACGPDGFIAYDVANIDNKGFSERIITAPVSPLGQKFYVKSKYATSICSPSTMALDPTRTKRPENEEGAVHPLYAYLYLTDRDEGLIVIGNPANSPNKAGVATLLDGDPDNNFLERAVTFNPSNALRGARSMTLHGHHAYICCDSGIVVVDLNGPLNPKVVSRIGSPQLSKPRKIQFQFRYGFVVDQQGMKVLDVTDPAKPRLVSNASIPISDARDIYLSRTHGYIAAGVEGLLIIDIERPEQPKLDQKFNADGRLNDSTAVRVGMTNTSMFAYIADGKNGLRVIQLTAPDDTPTFAGFSPRPSPRLVAQYKTHGDAISISEGLDRDRAVDEAGSQLSVFGRRGSRPMNLIEQQRLYLKDGKLFTVSDVPANEPLAPASQPVKVEEKKEEPAKRRPPRR